MTNFVLCRVCLSHNIRMYTMDNTRYREMYEKQTGAKLVTEGRPDTVCYICNSHLQRFFKFLQMSVNAEKYLNEMHYNGVALTQENVAGISSKHRSLSMHTAHYMSVTGTTEISHDADVTTNNTKEFGIPCPDKTIEDVADKTIEDVADKIIEDVADKTIEDVADKTIEDVAVKIESVDYEEIELNVSMEILDDDIRASPVQISEVVDGLSTGSDPPEYMSEASDDLNADSDPPEYMSEASDDLKADSDPPEYMSEASDDLNAVSEPHLHISEAFDDLDTVSEPHVNISEASKYLSTDSDRTKVESEPAMNKNEKQTESFNIKDPFEQYKLPKLSVVVQRMPITRSQAINEKPKSLNKFYSCKQCARRFRTVENLNTHRKSVHRPRGSKCECGKSFKNHATLKRHFIRVHTPSKQHNCPLCDRNFKHRSMFLVHIRTHTGEKPFDCKWCEKTFNDKSNRRKHMRTHTNGPARHACFMCDRTFSQRSRLKQHAVDHIL